MAKAIVIHVDGTVEQVDIDTDLSNLQRLIGGYLEMVTLDAKNHLYCDEEGKSKNLPINPLATSLVISMRRGFDDVIAGPAIVLGSAPDGGECDVFGPIIDHFPH